MTIKDKVAGNHHAKWTPCYCLYYGSDDSRDRESFRSLTGVIEWLKEHADGFLKLGNIEITQELFDEELCQVIED